MRRRSPPRRLPQAATAPTTSPRRRPRRARPPPEDTGAASDKAPGSKPADGASPAASAAEATPPSGAPATIPPPPPNGESPKRAVPDYDGRGDDPTTAGDVALWVPRIVFSPLYVVSEYVIRRPLEWLITTAERKKWPSAIVNLFFFGEDKKAGVVPTVFLDLGFRASVGFYAFWDDLLGKGNHLRLHFSTFGVDWVQAAVADKIPVGDKAFLDLRVEGVHRPDQLFHGLGPRSLQENRLRYGLDKVQVRPVFEAMYWRNSRITIDGGVRYMNFRSDTCCDDQPLSQAIAAGTFSPPPGYVDGYTAAFQRAELTIDTREDRPASQTGFRMELEVEQGSNVRKSASNWIRYGGSIGGYLDIKNNRTVSLAVTTLFVDPLAAGGEIPFTEQIVLGGSGLMRGYLYGRLTDRSAAVATLKYRWPIWVYLDGTIQAAFGNVFGPQLQGFEPKLLRFTSNIGIETAGQADHTFEVLLGLGTETFEDNLRVNSVRFLFGTNRGF
ncbi:MAG: BamA/TamA family outer membrane protein [Deltaproteobacteria bacterium]|nr:BamA/TamA family outer membrane protein [Deltaproteobacteria bacterium]